MTNKEEESFVPKTAVDIAEIRKDIKMLELTIQELREDFREFKTNYITRQEFDPVKRIAYGLVGVTLTTVLVAILSLIVIGNK